MEEEFADHNRKLTNRPTLRGQLYHPIISRPSTMLNTSTRCSRIPFEDHAYFLTDANDAFIPLPGTSPPDVKAPVPLNEPYFPGWMTTPMRLQFLSQNYLRASDRYREFLNHGTLEKENVVIEPTAPGILYCFHLRGLHIHGFFRVVRKRQSDTGKIDFSIRYLQDIFYGQLYPLHLDFRRWIATYGEQFLRTSHYLLRYFEAKLAHKGHVQCRISANNAPTPQRLDVTTKVIPQPFRCTEACQSVVFYEEMSAGPLPNMEQLFCLIDGPSVRSESRLSLIVSPETDTRDSNLQKASCISNKPLNSDGNSHKITSLTLQSNIGDHQAKYSKESSEELSAPQKLPNRNTQRVISNQRNTACHEIGNQVKCCDHGQPGLKSLSRMTTICQYSDTLSNLNQVNSSMGSAHHLAVPYGMNSLEPPHSTNAPTDGKAKNFETTVSNTLHCGIHKSTTTALSNTTDKHRPPMRKPSTNGKMKAKSENKKNLNMTSRSRAFMVLPSIRSGVRIIKKPNIPICLISTQAGICGWATLKNANSLSTNRDINERVVTYQITADELRHLSLLRNKYRLLASRNTTESKYNMQNIHGKHQKKQHTVKQRDQRRLRITSHSHYTVGKSRKLTVLIKESKKKASPKSVNNTTSLTWTSECGNANLRLKFDEDEYDRILELSLDLMGFPANGGCSK